MNEGCFQMLSADEREVGERGMGGHHREFSIEHTF